MTVGTVGKLKRKEALTGSMLALKQNIHTAAVATDKRRELGQVLTPKGVADFMATFFYDKWQSVELLDAGAGTGALTKALVRRLCLSQDRPERIRVTAYEIDACLIPQLKETLAACERTCMGAGVSFTAEVRRKDFVMDAVRLIRGNGTAAGMVRFNAAIVNPPYRKIRSDSKTRLRLRSIGIETSNLYTAFLSLIIKLLNKDGELVAITPRSFCNGPYFKAFRMDFLESMALQRIHVYESRAAAFKESEVLQENIIFHAMKNHTKPDSVIISSSSGAPGAAVSMHKVAYVDVVVPTDPEHFIHLVLDELHVKAKLLMNQLKTSLAELGLSVSTGRVVDFRAEPFLRQTPGSDTVPLIYPCHFNAGYIRWPKSDCRKPNAIVDSLETWRLLVPAGNYVLVKRFSAKEERRRIVACIYDTHRINARVVGFENHLNYFHTQGKGLPKKLAKGLAAFLNSTIVDTYFRQFSGHTQVNATDLRSLKYPTIGALERIGALTDRTGWEQDNIDRLVETEVFGGQSKHKHASKQTA
jgi:adenine-specific DNA-methyltransferase